MSNSAPRTYLTPTEYARSVGVTLQSILYQQHRELAPALVVYLGREYIDSAHPVAVSYATKARQRAYSWQTTRDRNRQREAAICSVGGVVGDLSTRSHAYSDSSMRSRSSSVSNASSVENTRSLEPSSTDSAARSIESEDSFPDTGEKSSVDLGDSSLPLETSLPRQIGGLRLPRNQPTIAAATAYLSHLPDEVRELSGMSLRDLVLIFGTDSMFLEWLKARREIERVHETELKNAERRGRLIARDKVKIGIIDPINSAHKKLLSDGSKSITTRVIAMHEAGKDEVEIRRWVQTQIGQFIKGAKARAKRALTGVQ